MSLFAGEPWGSFPRTYREKNNGRFGSRFKHPMGGMFAIPKLSLVSALLRFSIIHYWRLNNGAIRSSVKEPAGRARLPP